MNLVKKKMIEELYYKWCDNLQYENNEENKAYKEAEKILTTIEQADALNNYGTITQKNGFIAGFDMAIKLLIGDDCNA